MEVDIQLSDRDTKGLPDRLDLFVGRRLNVVISHECEAGKHIKKYCTDLQTSWEKCGE